MFLIKKRKELLREGKGKDEGGGGGGGGGNVALVNSMQIFYCYISFITNCGVILKGVRPVLRLNGPGDLKDRLKTNILQEIQMDFEVPFRGGEERAKYAFPSATTAHRT